MLLLLLLLLLLLVPYTFFLTRDWENFYFCVIRDSWYKPILRPREYEFWLFREREILFWISRDAWKGQIILRDSVIRKGIGDPLLNSYPLTSFFHLLEFFQETPFWSLHSLPSLRYSQSHKQEQVTTVTITWIFCSAHARAQCLIIIKARKLDIW